MLIMHDFICNDCGHQFEKLVKRTQDVHECPLCGSTKLNVQPSTSNFKVKGLGAYNTKMKV